ncbi:MAG: lipid A 3-O-deacylase [Rhodanobacteraceae bacterium]|nr:MAG: lipid A 3-O-deacylase [Rhodanobacteraceae bacterium]
MNPPTSFNQCASGKAARRRAARHWRIRATIAATVVWVCLWSAAAQARVEVSAGRSFTSHHQWTDAGFIEWVGAARPVWRLHWAPAFGLGRFSARRNSTDLRLHHAVWVGAAGARLYLWRQAFFGSQAAATGGRTDALSSPYEFVSSLGWQGRHWQLLVRHISNGDLHKPNHGETMLLVGMAF